MILGSNPAAIFAFGSRIDSRRYASSAVTVRPSLSWTGLLYSPLKTGQRPCWSTKWQVEHPNCANRDSPCWVREPPVPPPLCQLAYSRSCMTLTQPTMSECCNPQYSVQNSRYRPGLLAVNQRL